MEKALQEPSWEHISGAHTVKRYQNTSGRRNETGWL